VAAARSGEFERAEREYRVALAIDPRDGAAYRHLYNLLAEQRRNRDAVDVLRDLADAEAGLGRVRSERPALIAACQDLPIRNATDAVQYARTALSLMAAYNEELSHHVLAAAYAAAGRFPEAVSRAKLALATAPRGDAQRIALAEARLARYRAQLRLLAPRLLFEGY
jgi:tetratricopeptide (TPR) repeat protein